LTALIETPQRLVFLSSELHQVGQSDLSDLQSLRRWSGFRAYSNLKLFVVALAFNIARRWPNVKSCGGVIWTPLLGSRPLPAVR
jgi:hypothetical protein